MSALDYMIYRLSINGGGYVGACHVIDDKPDTTLSRELARLMDKTMEPASHEKAVCVALRALNRTEQRRVKDNASVVVTCCRTNVLSFLKRESAATQLPRGYNFVSGRTKITYQRSRATTAKNQAAFKEAFAGCCESLLVARIDEMSDRFLVRATDDCRLPLNRWQRYDVRFQSCCSREEALEKASAVAGAVAAEIIVNEKPLAQRASPDKYSKPFKTYSSAKEILRARLAAKRKAESQEN